MRGRWDDTQWQLDPYKWYLHNNRSSRYARIHYNRDRFVFIPRTYERNFIRKIMRLLSNEGTFGCMIVVVMCFTFYMHTFLLDNSRSNRVPIPTFTHIKKSATKESVMVAIIMHNPSKYLKTTLTALNESNHEADIFVFRNYVGDQAYYDTLQRYPKVQFVSDKGRTKSIHIVNFIMDRFISSKYNVLVYINSFSVLSIDWWFTLKQCLNQSRGIFSLYGIERDEKHTDKRNDLLCSQAWLEMVGSVWRRNLASRVLSETSNIEGNLHSKMEFWCRMFQIPLQSVRHSVMAVIDSEKRNYSLITPKSSVRREIQKQIPDEKLGKASFTNHSKPIRKKMQPLENEVASNIAYKTHSSLECIAAVLIVHIYRGDRERLTSYEIEQWIRYMQHAGVNIVYLYDAYESKDEMLHKWVTQVFEPDEIIYHDWYFNRTVSIREWHQTAYNHAADHYEKDCEWHIHTSMTEYPLIVNDTKKGFLKRLVKRVKSSNSNCTNISFPVFRFFGNPTQDQWLIGRFQYRYSKVFPGRVQLFMTKRIKTEHHYHNGSGEASTESLDPKLARINQYLRVGMNKSTADINESLDKIIPDTTIFPLLGHLKQDILISNKMPLYVTNQFWDYTY